MALNTETQALAAFKKAFNKPHTSPDFQLLANELLNVGFSSSSTQILGQKLNPTPPSNFYSNDGVVEKVILETTFIPGTNTSDGYHSFYCSLPSDYETNSLNPKKGIFPFVNGQDLNSTNGSLQIVPVFLGGNQYESKLFDGNSSQIFPLDARDWFLYDFGGIVYQDKPPTTGVSSLNPSYLECWIYIGDMVSDVQSQDNKVISSTAVANSGETVVLDTVSIAEFRTCKWVVSVNDTTNSTFMSLEVLSQHDNTNSTNTQYAFQGMADVSFDTDVNSGQMRLLVTAKSNNQIIKAERLSVSV